MKLSPLSEAEISQLRTPGLRRRRAEESWLAAGLPVGRVWGLGSILDQQDITWCHVCMYLYIRSKWIVAIYGMEK